MVDNNFCQYFEIITLLSKWLSVFSLKLMSGELPESFLPAMDIVSGSKCWKNFPKVEKTFGKFKDLINSEIITNY